MRARRAWVRKSGVVSIRMLRSCQVIRMDGRSRLSRGSVEVHTLQWHPMVGTPTLVPEPSTVIRRGTSGIRLLSRRLAGVIRDLNEAEPKLGKGILEQALLLEGEIAFSLLEQDAQHVDGVPREKKIGLGLFVRGEAHQT